MDPDRQQACLDQSFVVIESPFKGDVERNVLYADCLLFDAMYYRGEAVFMGHLIYPRVFNDANQRQRELSIRAHIAVLARANYVVYGTDLGPPTDGMIEAMDLAKEWGIPVYPRSLGEGWETKYPLHRTDMFR